MNQINTAINSPTDVRLLLCGCGSYHLTVGNATLHLTEDDLALVGRAVVRMSERRPILLSKLMTGLVDSAAAPAGNN